jgi:hemerythrin-like domain-containing protein
MTASRADASGSRMQDDPVLQLQREHTLLAMLAEGMREMARALEHGVPVAPERVREGLEIRRGFLVDLHQQKEEWLAEAGVAGDPEGLRQPREECRVEHRRVREVSDQLQAVWEEWRSGAPNASERLARLLAAEADRITAHMQHEEESVHPVAQRALSPAAVDRLLEKMNSVVPQLAPLESRLQAWSSQFHPASD